jgi:hypothetical protein
LLLVCCFLFVATSKTTDQFFKAITNSKAPNGLVLTDEFNYILVLLRVLPMLLIGLEFGILADWHMQVTIYLLR